MSLSINQNIMAMNSYRNLSATQNGLSKSLEKLSSGFRINRAADDAAGLAISEGLRSQVGGNKQAVRNAQDGISVVQTAEGALQEVHSILQRMRDLAVQGANDSNDDKARANIKTELDQLREELGRIGEATNFNGTKLLDGTATGTDALKFQVGANGDSASRIVVDLKDADISGIAQALSYDGYESTDLSSITAKEVYAKATNPITIRVGGKDYTYTPAGGDEVKKVAEELQKKLDAPATGVKWTSQAALDAPTAGKFTILEIGDQKLTSKGTAGSLTKEAIVADFQQQIDSNSQLKGKFEAKLDAGKLVVESVGDDPVQNIAIKVTKTANDANGASGADVQGDSVAGVAESSVKGKFKVSAVEGKLKVSTADGTDMPKDLVLTKSNNANIELAEITPEKSDPLTVKDHASAQKLVALLDEKISSVSTARANLGAVQNRFDHTINNLNVAVENLSASESRIRDTDMAQEMMQFTKNQILSQAGTAMLAQANQVPQGVLSLLR